MQFYIKDENGDFVDGQGEVDRVITGRLDKYKESETKKIRESATEALRGELTTELTGTLTESIEAKYAPKLKEAEDKVAKLDVSVRQKTIAAEYGFKPDLEGFLGEGTDEEMKAKADILKNTTGNAGAPAKKTVEEDSNSFIQLKKA